jgi:hypothetical protein
MIEEEYREIEEDMIREARKYGRVVSLRIPRPRKHDEFPEGAGHVFIEFDNVNQTRVARRVC